MHTHHTHNPFPSVSVTYENIPYFSLQPALTQIKKAK